MDGFVNSVFFVLDWVCCTLNFDFKGFSKFFFKWFVGWVIEM